MYPKVEPYGFPSAPWMLLAQWSQCALGRFMHSAAPYHVCHWTHFASQVDKIYISSFFGTQSSQKKKPRKGSRRCRDSTTMAALLIFSWPRPYGRPPRVVNVPAPFSPRTKHLVGYKSGPMYPLSSWTWKVFSWLVSSAPCPLTRPKMSSNELKMEAGTMEVLEPIPVLLLETLSVPLLAMPFSVVAITEYPWWPLGFNKFCCRS